VFWLVEASVLEKCAVFIFRAKEQKRTSSEPVTFSKTKHSELSSHAVCVLIFQILMYSASKFLGFYVLEYQVVFMSIIIFPKMP
jgi:hypothetical protein